MNILSLFNLAFAFKGVLFERISSPVQSARLASLFVDIKNIFKDEKDRANAICKSLNLLIAFKKEHPQDFDELFEIIKNLLQSYEQNPKEIAQSIKELLK